MSDFSEDSSNSSSGSYFKLNAEKRFPPGPKVLHLVNAPRVDQYINISGSSSERNGPDETPLTRMPGECRDSTNGLARRRILFLGMIRAPAILDD